MKACDEIRELLSEHMDGMLDPEKRPMVQEHLSQCPACRAELDKLESLSKGIKGLKKVEAPADFSRGIRERIGNRKGLDGFLKNLFKNEEMRVPVMLVATVVVVITVAKMTDMYYQAGMYEQDALKRIISIEQRKADVMDHMMTADSGPGASYAEKAEEAQAVSTGSITMNGAVALDRKAAHGYAPEMEIAAKSYRQAVETASYIIIVETRLDMNKAQSKIGLLLKKLNIKILDVVKVGDTMAMDIALPYIVVPTLIDELEKTKIGHIVIPVVLPSQGAPGQEYLALRIQVKKV